MTTTKRDTMNARIDAHGRKLLAIFPRATERDPAKLCKRLRRLETEANYYATRLCDGDVSDDERKQDARIATILGKVDAVLGFRATAVPVFFNGDPRGYTLKIADDYMRAHNVDLHRDWGGYGILAPDLTDGNG